MKWADALKASPIKRAERSLLGDSDPNVILMDPKFKKSPKLFRATSDEAWERVKLKDAAKYEDWVPVVSPPTYGVDNPTQVSDACRSGGPSHERCGYDGRDCTCFCHRAVEDRDQ